MAKPLPPFSCTFSPNIPELLYDLSCSLAITTYQAGKLVLISPKNKEELIQLPRNFNRPMGIAYRKDKMAVASRDEITILSNSPRLAANYPNQPGVYDAFFAPRTTYYTGQVDIHDLEWEDNGLTAVVTRFSCLARTSYSHSFEPYWTPHFITELAPEDRCHLNGVAYENGKPAYVTALGNSNKPQGWRENKLTGGVLMDVATNKIVVEGLPMPHSPRIYHNQVYCLLSATGALARCDVHKGTFETLKEFSGFVRGMDMYEDYLFIGLSKLRQNSSSFRDLPIAKKSVFAGVMVVYLPQMSVVGFIKYETSVEEIYEVKVIPNVKRPGLLSTLKHDHKLGISLPNNAFWGAKQQEEDHTENAPQ